MENSRRIRKLIKILASVLGVNVLLSILPFLLLVSHLPVVLSVEIDSEEPIEASRVFFSREKCRAANWDHDGDTHMYVAPLKAFDRISLNRNYGVVVPNYAVNTPPTLSLCFQTTNTFTITALRVTVGDLFSREITPETLHRQYEIGGCSKLIGCDSDGLKVHYGGCWCSLMPKKGCKVEWSGWRLSPNGFVFPVFLSYFLFAFEVSLLLLSGWLVLKFDLRLVRQGIGSSVWVAVLCAAFFVMCIPLQSYASNSISYDFSANDILIDVLPTLIFTGLVFSVGLSLTSYAFGSLMHFLLLAVVFYFYLQTGILSIGFPPMNGDFGYYLNTKLAIRDYAIAMVVFALTMLCAFKRPKWLSVCSICVGLLVFASLVDAYLTGVQNESTGGFVPQQQNVAGGCPRGDVPKHVTFSSRRNVLVFVLDSFTTEVCGDLLKCESSLAESFPGFTSFQNNVGKQSESIGATLDMLAGDCEAQYHAHDLTVSNFHQIVFQDGMLLSSLQKTGCPLYVMPAECTLGMGIACPQRADVRTSLEDSGSGATLGTDMRPLFRKDDYQSFSFSLAELCWFRITPFSMKKEAYRLLYTHSMFGRSDEAGAYAPLKKVSLQDEPFTFCYLHTGGAHVPHAVDRHGNQTEVSMGGYRSYYEHAYYAFNHLARLMDSLRKKGVYDNSYIVVLADHGSHSMGDTKHPVDYQNGMLSLRTFPMLMVKPAGASGPVAIDEKTPTWHGNLNALFKTVLTNNLDIASTRKILMSSRRVFVHPDNRSCELWTVNENRDIVEYDVR